MFIELPNETRVNTDQILKYKSNARVLYVQLSDDFDIEIEFDTEDEAKLALHALDRAIGVKPLMIRK